MARYFVLALLVACIVCAQSATIQVDIPDDKVKYDVAEDDVSPTTSSSVISSDGNGDKLADFTSDKTTAPNRQRPTKKPGTYLQSIWDIYSS